MLKALLCFMSAALCSFALQANQSPWWLRAYAGGSYISELDARSTRLGSIDGNSDLDIKNGWLGGVGVGYQLNSYWGLEFAWEYRRNDSSMRLADNQDFDDGRFSSNLYSINLHYAFNERKPWHPYFGGGVVWAQQSRLRLEQNGLARQFSTNNDWGYQAFLGSEYSLDSHWRVHGELRYTAVDDLRMPERGGRGLLSDMNYRSTSLQLGVRYRF